MSLAPGQPREATVHPRTREEASDYAKRNRGTSDWYRHDGKNVEEQTAPAPRLATEKAEEIAAKHKGDADQWFQHNENAAPEPAPAPKPITEEAKVVQEKVEGTDEKWFKHEDNQDYVTPRAQHENLPDFSPAKSFKVKFTKPDTNEWYKHSSGGGSPGARSPPPKPKKVISPREAPDPPKWFHHDGTINADLLPQATRNLHTADAEEYQARNQGSAGNWFGHDAKAEPDVCQSPRFASKEGCDIAKRLGRESEQWYDYDANKGYNNPRPEAKGSQVSGMLERSRGQMGNIMTMSTEANGASPTKTRPEAKEIADKNQKGLMDKYLAENKDYNSARPAPRVKPEAQQAAEKNKGVMAGEMGGYPDTPREHSNNRVKPDAQQYAKRNQGSLGTVISGGEPAVSPADRHSQARAVKPEAQQYADRNKGSSLFGATSPTETPRSHRGQSDAAREIASRNQGSMGGILGFSG